MTGGLARLYSESGYCSIPSLYSATDMELVMTRVDEVFSGAIRKGGHRETRGEDGRLDFVSLVDFFKRDPDGYISCAKACQNFPEVFAMGANEHLLALLHELGLVAPAFSTKPIFTMMNSQTSRSFSTWKLPAHQDWRSIQGSLNNIVVWISVTDTTPALGPLEVIPGSHLRGLLPIEKDDWYGHVSSDEKFEDKDFISTPLNQGDALVFSSFLVHRSGHISTDRHRCSIQFRYNDLSEPSFVERDYPTTYDSDRPTRDYVEEGFSPSIEQIRKLLPHHE